MSEYGPNPLYGIYSIYVFLDALWAWELERIKARWEEEQEARRTSWKDIIVLDSSQPVHIKPLAMSEADKLFDEMEGKGC